MRIVIRQSAGWQVVQNVGNKSINVTPGSSVPIPAWSNTLQLPQADGAPHWAGGLDIFAVFLHRPTGWCESSLRQNLFSKCASV